MSNVITVTVDANLVAGTVAASQTICYNTAPAAFTSSTLPTGGTGSYTYQWQSASALAGPYANITSATSTTYAPGALTATTYYRRNETSGTCGTVSSNVITVTVYAALTGGTVATTPQTICYNTAPSAFTSSALPTGADGIYTYQWQSASASAGPYADISGATSTTYTSGALTATTYFRRNATSTTCGTTASSNVITINVDANLVAGTVGSNQTICYNTSPAAFTSTALPTGGTGTYTYQWQSSPDNITFTNISGATATTYTSGALTATTYFRRNETSGTCGTVSSNVITVTVDANLVAGTVAASQTICYNTAPAAFMSSTLPTGGTGTYTYQWQSASALAGPYANITGATSTTYAPGALTATTYYRRNETSGTCGTVSSNVITVTVYANIAGGTIAAAQTICYNTAPAAFTNSVSPTGADGTYTYQWQSSPDNTTWTNISGATSIAYTSGALTVTTYFRRNATAPTCGTTASSNSIKIIVNPNVDYGTVASGNQAICYGGDPNSITFSTAPSGGGATFTYQWYSQAGSIACPTGTSTAGWTALSGNGAKTATYNPPAGLATTTTYAVIVTPSQCGVATWANSCRQVTVNPLPTITTTGIAAPKCFSASAQTSTLAYTATTQAPTTYSINWASGLTDVNATLPGSPITIPIPAGLAPNTYNGTLTVTNGNGCTSNGVPVSITINALPVPTLTNSPASPVCQNTTVTYTTDASQSNYVWTFSGTAGTDYTLVSGGNNTSNTAVVTWLTTGTKTVTVNYTNGNTCTAVTPTSNSITVLAIPTGSVTVTENSGTTPNDNTICSGDAVTFTAPNGGTGASYTEGEWNSSARAKYRPNI